MPTTYTGRIDSNSANNASLNLTGDDAITVTFVPEGLDGDIVLENDDLTGIDENTQVTIAGDTNGPYDFTFEFSGTLPTTNSNGANQVPAQFQGSEVYVITIYDYPAPGESTRFVFMPDEDASLAEWNAFGNGAISPQNLGDGPGVICFAAGTRLETPNGARAVEDLKAGDTVTTTGGETLPIIWISSSHYTLPNEAGDAVPVLISEGALGHGLPARNLVVSPQHKVRLEGDEIERFCGVREVLAPAKGLTGLPGVRRMNGRREITYFHVLLARHAVMVSEGLGSESFYPGSTAMRMLSFRQRMEIHRTCPDLRTQGYGPTALTCLTKSAAEKLVDRMKARLLEPQD